MYIQYAVKFVYITDPTPNVCRRLRYLYVRVQNVYRCSSTKSRVRKERLPGSYEDKERKRRLGKKEQERSAYIFRTRLI